MHRLQISLPGWQHQFLLQRARRDGVSIAEVVRQLIEREAQARAAPSSDNSVWTIAGIAEDSGPLVGGVPVSEAPDLYLADLSLPGLRGKASLRRRPRAKRRTPR